MVSSNVITLSYSVLFSFKKDFKPSKESAPCIKNSLPLLAITLLFLYIKPKLANEELLNPVPGFISTSADALLLSPT